jgi:hypothetical protein
MSRKDSTPPLLPQLRQQSTSPYQESVAVKESSNNTPSTNGSGTPPIEHRNGNGHVNGFYENVAGSTPYPSIAYSEQAAATAVSTNTTDMSSASAYDLSDNTQYLYAATAVAGPASDAMDQPPSASNPLVAFASQATQHVSNQAGDDEDDNWRHQALAAAAAAQVQAAHVHNGGNTWHNWTAAIAENQDRYSANALLTLGSGRAGDLGSASGLGDATGAHMVGLGAVSGGVTSHAGQWPLLLFDGTGVSGA